MPTTADLDYLAGLVDADGYITLSWLNRRALAQAILGVTNTHRGLVAWLLETFGGYPCRSGKRSNEAHAGLGAWRIAGEAAVPLLAALQSRLRIKAAQAWLAREFQAQYTPTPKGYRIPEEEKALRLGFVEAMHYLNRSGPTSSRFAPTFGG